MTSEVLITLASRPNARFLFTAYDTAPSVKPSNLEQRPHPPVLLLIVQHTLGEMSKPIRYELKNGGKVNAHTPFTTRAKELMQLYNGLNLPQVCLGPALMHVSVAWCINLPIIYAALYTYQHTDQRWQLHTGHHLLTRQVLCSNQVISNRNDRKAQGLAHITQHIASGG